MEEAWLATPDRATLTSWRPGYIQKFVRQIGTDYDFLFSEHSAKFVPNGGKSRHAMDWAVVTIQAGTLLLRFARDRGDFDLSFASANNSGHWVGAMSISIVVFLNGKEESGDHRIKLPPISEVLHDHFEAFEKALSEEHIDETEVSWRNIRQKLSAGTLDVFNVAAKQRGAEQDGLNIRPDFGFLANYAKISDDIGRVPFWKPLAIYAGIILLLPLLLLVLIVGGPFYWYFKQTSRKPLQIARQ